MVRHSFFVKTFEAELVVIPLRGKGMDGMAREPAECRSGSALAIHGPPSPYSPPLREF